MFKRTLATSLTLLLTLLVSGLGASAAVDSKSAAASPVPAAPSHTRGLLWKIERAGLKPSYLFGTIHIGDPRVTNLPAPVAKAFDEASRFAMETMIDAGALMQILESAYFGDGRTLETVLGASTYADVRRAYTERGLPTEDLARQKPWFVLVTLSTPPPDGTPLDLQLQVRALSQGKPTHGLETVREQVAIFDDMPLPDQVALVKEVVRDRNELPKYFSDLLEAYLARDLGRIAEIAEKHGPDDRKLHDRVMHRLLGQRNRRMVERLQPHLQHGNAFIAIGAGHLSGREGVLQLLERVGYRVHAIY